VVAAGPGRLQAQSFSAEQNGDGSYTLAFSNGVNITTNTNGTYSAGNTGSCSGCNLPEVTVYGYVTTNSNPVSPTYIPTSYYYNGQYYNFPPPPQPDPNMPPPGTPILITTTNPSPAPPPPPVKNPCDNAMITNSPGNINLPNFASALSSLTSGLASSISSTPEESMFLGTQTVSGGGPMATTPTPGGEATAGGNPGATPNFLPFAGVHTHPNGIYTAPSAGDIYNLATYNAQYPTYTTIYVVAPGGVTTALVVTNPTALASFLSTYPPSTYETSDGKFAGSLWTAFGTADLTLDPAQNLGSAANQSAWQNATAYMLDTYNTGLTMMTEDSNGNFHQVHIVKGTDSNGNPSYTQYNCKYKPVS